MSDSCYKMEPKQIFLFPQMCQHVFDNSVQENYHELKRTNQKLHDILLKYKDFINEYHTTRTWDRYKKLANDYELVSSNFGSVPCLTQHHSISRSYYKLWEILYDFNVQCIREQKPLTCAFLAEGPGGFIEAFTELRKATMSGSDPIDKIYGMTLISTNKSVPSWKLPQQMILKNNIVLLNGEDKTGSLYHMPNIKTLKTTIGENQCDIVTCDGGFDFSRDYNIQEEVSSRLITCELYATLKLQKKGGLCIIKVFDICNTDTLFVLYVLSCSYSNVHITKPYSSRPANSEKYVVCTGFNGCDEQYLQLLENSIIKKIPIDNNLLGVQLASKVHQILPAVIKMNKYFIAKQMQSIVKAITMIEEYIETKSSSPDHVSTFKDVLYRQVEYAIRWCHHYNIQVNFKVLKTLEVCVL